MKKILLSIATIAAVGVVAFAASQAFFSDEETSTGNTFVAGQIDLRFQADDGDSNWSDVNGNPLFDTTSIAFLDDMKPGDKGERTVKLWVDNNPSCGKVSVSVYEDMDNTCTTPELLDETDCLPEGEGELNEEVNWFVWADTSCDNVFDDGEEPLTTGTVTEDKVYGIGELPIGVEAAQCYGIAYCFGEWTEEGTCDGSLVDNSSQTDSFKADIIIEALQKRNQFDQCPVGDWPLDEQPQTRVLRLENETEVTGGPWTVIVDDKYVDMTYKTSGSTFDYSLVGQGLAANTEYSLIYYADPFPGNNPGALIGKHTTGVSGAINVGPFSKELNMDLPDPADANYSTGAKIWFIPSNAYIEASNSITWPPDFSTWFFEGNVYIHYDDTGI